MKKNLIGKVVGVILISALILGSTAILGSAMTAAQATADKEIVVNSIENWLAEGADYEIPISDGIPGLYTGISTANLMPIDLTLTKSDVPKLLDSLNTSKYGAVYLDNEIYLRVMNNGIIQVSKDNGVMWEEYTSDIVESKDFAVWLLKNDPNPGYSMKEMQTRLENGAEVKHIMFENGKEMYFIMDADGVQTELVQSEKAVSVLIDSQRMMITSVRSTPFLVSEEMLESFYNLLVSCEIMTETETEQDFEERMAWFESNINFDLNNPPLEEAGDSCFKRELLTNSGLQSLHRRNFP